MSESTSESLSEPTTEPTTESLAIISSTTSPTNNDLKLADKLAIQRTELAADRTIMAWIRTSFSMISFGFTLFKFFQYLKSDGIGAARNLSGPRMLGILLITLGTLALAIAAWDYFATMTRLKAQTGEKYRGSLPLFVSIAVAIIGMLAFIGLALHIGPLES